ncbi:MAG: hypothetical protein ACKPKO_41335, partial [Candidatus Fonsibacter sp.]
VPVPGQRLEFPEHFRRQSPARFNIASSDDVSISGLTDAEYDFMRLPHRGTSVPAHPPVPPSEPGVVNQSPQLLIPPEVRPTAPPAVTPTRPQRGRSRNPQGTQNDIDIQAPPQERQHRGRSRNPRGTQNDIDMQQPLVLMEAQVDEQGQNCLYVAVV